METDPTPPALTQQELDDMKRRCSLSNLPADAAACLVLREGQTDRFSAAIYHDPHPTPEEGANLWVLSKDMNRDNAQLFAHSKGDLLRCLAEIESDKALL